MAFRRFDELEIPAGLLNKFKHDLWGEVAWNSEIELTETIYYKCGGTKRKFFNYMLMDGKIFNYFRRVFDGNINDEVITLFLSGCFYIGKGQADRPSAHFEEARDNKNANEKVAEIRRIWEQNDGVFVLKFFGNATSYEAYTREAILIEFADLENLANSRKGVYYGGIDTWHCNRLRNIGKCYMSQIILECYGQHNAAVLKNDVF